MLWLVLNYRVVSIEWKSIEKNGKVNNHLYARVDRSPECSMICYLQDTLSNVGHGL